MDDITIEIRNYNDFLNVYNHYNLKDYMFLCVEGIQPSPEEIFKEFNISYYDHITISFKEKYYRIGWLHDGIDFQQYAHPEENILLHNEFKVMIRKEKIRRLRDEKDKDKR